MSQNVEAAKNENKAVRRDFVFKCVDRDDDEMRLQSFFGDKPDMLCTITTAGGHCSEVLMSHSEQVRMLEALQGFIGDSARSSEAAAPNNEAKFLSPATLFEFSVARINTLLAAMQQQRASGASVPLELTAELRLLSDVLHKYGELQLNQH